MNHHENRSDDEREEYVTLEADASPAEPPPLPPDAPPPAPPAPAAPPKVIYVVDSSRSTFGELARDQGMISMLIASVAKVLRVRLPGSVNDPNVERLAPFEVAEATVPPAVREAMEPAVRSLAALGFEAVAAHEIVDLFNQSRTHLVTLGRAGGSAVARVWNRTEAGGAKTHAYVDFLTEHADGSFSWTTSAKSTLLAPPNVHVTRQVGASPETLWQHHQAAVQRRSMASDAQPISAAAAGREQVLALAERHHALVRDFHLARGVFRPMRPGDQQRAAELETHVNAVPAEGMAYPEVWAELVRMQQARRGWGGAVLLLLVSLMLFVGMGAARWEWEFVLLLVVLLLFHELGHFVAMKIFRYRNLRMFFIPLMGAAVSGVNYSAPGWKKVIVALMGPLPGIVLGAVLGVAGYAANSPILIKAAVLSLILNGLNLLPVLPLDGGRVMHTLYFSRHWVLDVIFRVVAAVVLIAGSYAIGDRLLMFLGIFMLIGIPLAYKLARVAGDLRRQGVRLAAPGEQMVPPDVAQQIIGKLRASFPAAAKSSKATAQHTLNIYETINTRSPGWLATIAFTVLHVGALVMAIVLGSLLVVVQQGGIGRLREMALESRMRPPKHALVVENIRVSDGPPLAAPTTAPSAVIATFPAPADAERAFAELGEKGRMTLFGQSLMLPVVADRAARERWFDELERRTRDVFVAHPDGPGSLALECRGPTNPAAAEALLAEAQEYLTMPEQLHLIPPWSPRYAPPEQREAWRRARATFLKLYRNVGQMEDPAGKAEAAALAKRAADLRRRGDTEALAAVEEEQSKLFERRRAESRRRILDPADRTIDHELGRAYVKLTEAYEHKVAAAEDRGEVGGYDEDEEAGEYLALLRSYARELGPRMGQVELDAAGQPVAGANAFSARSGYATSRPPDALRFRWMTFYDPVEGAPALARWLAASGCRDFKYEFNYGDVDELLGGFDDDED